jgi:hypothetical protein
MAWDDIPLFDASVDTLSAEDLNERLNGLLNRTDILRNQITNEFILNGVGFTDSALQNCQKGRFVSYNPKTQRYQHSTTGDTTVVGLLITEPAVFIENGKTYGQGTILTSGVLRNAEIIEVMTNSTDPATGAYYLANDGRLTQNVTDTRTAFYCGTLTSTGCFIVDIQLPSEMIDEDGNIVNPSNMPNIIADEDSIIEVSTSGNTITVGTVGKLSTEKIDGTAVAQFDSNGYALCPVVNKVIAGSGINITGSKGEFTISAQGLTNETYIDMNIVNSTGIVFGTSVSDFNRIKFPVGISSQIAGTLRVPNQLETYTAQIFAHLDQNSVELRATIQVLTPGDSNSVQVKEYGLIFGNDSLVSSDSFNVPAGSLVTLVITANKPSQQISLISCGIKVTAPEK